MMEAIEFLANVTAYSILIETIFEVAIAVFAIIVFIWIFLTSF